MEPLYTYLGVNTDDFVALLAAISENALVAFDAVRVLVPEHVTLPGQRFITLPATEMAAVPVLVHRLRVLATENQLETKNATCLETIVPARFLSERSLDPIPLIR